MSNFPNSYDIPYCSQLGCQRTEPHDHTHLNPAAGAFIERNMDMTNYTQQCQRPDCDASFDGATKSVFCSDRCEIAALRAELESLNDTLKPWTTKTAHLLRQYVADTSEGFECLSKCDSYGHDEIDALRADVAVQAETIGKLKEECERQADLSSHYAQKYEDILCDARAMRAEIATFRNASPSLCNCSQCLDLRKE